MVASGMAWETIIEEWHGNITREAIAEAVSLASKALLDHVAEYALEPILDRPALARLSQAAQASCP